MNAKTLLKNYGLLISMVVAIVAGCIVGAVWPGATALEPLGTVFMNLMYCIVVPLVFSSVASTVANTRSRKRSGKILGLTISSFVVTGVIACIIMIVIVNIIPPVTSAWSNMESVVVDELTPVTEMIVNLLTTNDFAGLLSRRAILPLIVFSILFGFGVNMSGGAESAVGKWLENLSDAMMKIMTIITYYAPIAFFGFFANLVATYGAEITSDYARALAIYYPLSVIYLFTAFPIWARFGGGKGAVKIMFSHVFRPAVTALATCSSIANIPTNLNSCKETGVPDDVAEMVIPLGATMHMDGNCFSGVLKIAFLCGVFGIPFTGVSFYAKIIIVCVLSAVGASGIPGGGYISEYIICAVFFPDNIELAYPIAITIGNLVDPPSTMMNSVGDYVITFVVARFMDGKDWMQKKLAADNAAHKV
ncbi:MAG: dicarboxylate/amino acid:cation symporter [Lachnospiraceae bacterium]